MKKKIVYENVSLGKYKIIPNFFPKPQDLVLKETNIRVTLNLSSDSVVFFKRLGKKNHIPYQKLIRRALDAMASHAT